MLASLSVECIHYKTSKTSLARKRSQTARVISVSCSPPISPHETIPHTSPTCLSHENAHKLCGFLKPSRASLLAANPTSRKHSTHNSAPPLARTHPQFSVCRRILNAFVPRTTPHTVPLTVPHTTSHHPAGRVPRIDPRLSGEISGSWSLPPEKRDNQRDQAPSLRRQRKTLRYRTRLQQLPPPGRPASQTL